MDHLKRKPLPPSSRTESWIGSKNNCFQNRLCMALNVKYALMLTFFHPLYLFFSAFFRPPHFSPPSNLPPSPLFASDRHGPQRTASPLHTKVAAMRHGVRFHGPGVRLEKQRNQEGDAERARRLHHRGQRRPHRTRLPRDCPHGTRLQLPCYLYLVPRALISFKTHLWREFLKIGIKKIFKIYEAI